MQDLLLPAQFLVLVLAIIVILIALIAVTKT